MQEQESYYFDPCGIDNSDVSLDSWEPIRKSKKLPISQWRQKQNDGNFNQDPGLDELKKIMMHLKHKHADSEIMQLFGINCETLLAIKTGKYDPVDGISLSNQSKIYKEFDRLNKKLSKCLEAFRFINDNIFTDVEMKNNFSQIISTTTVSSKKKKPAEIDKE